MTLRRLDSILTTVLDNTRAKMNVHNLRKAHEAAADFHSAMDEALGVQDEIDSAINHARETTNSEWRAESLAEARELEPRFAAALGKAAVALLKMPTRWAAVLEMELEAAHVMSNVVPLKAAE